MNTKTHQYRLSVFALFLAFLVSACQPKAAATEQPEASLTPAATSSETIPGGSSPMAVSKDIFLDPALAQDKDSLMISEYLYEGLVVLDATGDVQPGLAESWVISDDQLDYIFTLRPGAVFSDGTAITPDIIADNFNRWFDPKNPLHKDGEYTAWENTFLGFLGEKDENDRAKSSVDGIQKVDSSTVLLHLSRPVPETLTYLANPAFAILNTNVVALGEYGTQDSQITSSGPYVVSAWNDEGLVLAPNAEYWDTPPTGNLNFTWR
jgi:peptide/nickel transport system substrate-binding protein